MGTQSFTSATWQAGLMASIPDLQRTQVDLYTTAASTLITQQTAALHAAMQANDMAAAAAAASRINTVAAALDSNAPIVPTSGAAIVSPASAAFIASLMPTPPVTPAKPVP